MKFTISTKPLKDSLDLGVINANISSFNQKSVLAQITASARSLKINIEALQIITEIRLPGSGDADVEVSTSVSSVLLKQLVSTFDANTTILEFVEGGLVLHSGKSKFMLPQLIDTNEASLATPALPDFSAPRVKLNTEQWKFIKNRQMFAAAMSYVKPVYTMAWAGDDGNLVVGDFDLGLFTLSQKNSLDRTCLLTDTVVNLLVSVPEGSELIKHDNSYLVCIKQDTFEMVSQFTPRYESEEDIGSYNSGIFIGMIRDNQGGGTSVATEAVKKILGQADLLSTGSEATIMLSMKDNKLRLVDSNVDCYIDVIGEMKEEYEVEFKTALLKSVFANYPEETVKISPCKSEDGDEVAGIVVSSDDLAILLSGVD